MKSVIYCLFGLKKLIMLFSTANISHLPKLHYRFFLSKTLITGVPNLLQCAVHCQMTSRQLCFDYARFCHHPVLV